MAIPSSSTLSQQRSPSTQPMHTSISSQHLNPHSNPTFSSYASSISSSPNSRPSSPASMATVPTPPQSPTSFALKTMSSPTPPPIHSTVIALGSHLGGSSAPSPDYTGASSFQDISLLSLLTQPVTRIVLVLTIILSLVALGGKFPDHCTSPSQVLYAHQYPSLLASPFVVPLTPLLLAGAQQTLGSALLLASSNIISLALFEDHLTTIFNGNGTTIFRNLLLVLMALIMAMRQFLGFIFSRAVGWKYPGLFFSDSVFECNLGLAPYLFALLVIQSLFPDPPSDRSSSTWTLRRTHVQIILCLFNVVPKTIIWWAGSGMIVGFLITLAITYQRRMGRWGGKVKTSIYEKQLWETDGYEFLADDDQLGNEDGSAQLLNEFVPPRRERMLLLSMWKALTFILPTILLCLLVLLGANHVHTIRHDVPNIILNQNVEPQTPYLLTLIMMTAPRDQGSVYIKETLSSYLANFPDESVDPLYSRIQIVVYTHFTDYPGYDEAKAYFDTIPKARKHVKWVREEGSERNQRKHLVSAIRKIGTAEDTVYLGIMEEDFSFCDGGWQEMLNTVYEANRQVPDHCGIFIATGGSGLIFKRSVALTASFILEGDVLTKARGGNPPPPDVTLQDCMLGRHDYCSTCAGTLVSSRTLLQGHLGYNSSTSGADYDRSEFQCGWRHPFNGYPFVHTL